MTTVDLAKLREGAKVKLVGPSTKPGPRKPYPLGWRTVNAVDRGGKSRFGAVPASFKVDGDPRWLPIELIEEIEAS